MFKDRLKQLREENKLTQKELGDKIYVSRSAICKWEMGSGIPSDVNLKALCEFFNVDEEWLLDRNDMKEMVEKLNNDNKNNYGSNGVPEYMAYGGRCSRHAGGAEKKTEERNVKARFRLLQWVPPLFGVGQ
mgnify:CR=1 FL=1